MDRAVHSEPIAGRITFENDFIVPILVTFNYELAGMELRHLRYFLAVAEELNFRKAAERLNLSRPALSKQVKDLEGELNVRLLERDTARVSLTKAGEVLMEDARRILRLARQAVERAAEAQSGHRGKLRIGSVGVIATDFMPETLKAFNLKFPGVEVSFAEMQGAEQLAALAARKIDIGFAFGEGVASLKGHHSLRVLRSEFGLAVAKGHPLARHTPVKLAEIRSHTMLCIGPARSSPHRDAIQRICGGGAALPGPLRLVEGFDSLLMLIAADQGISLIPLVLDLSTQGIVILPIQAPPEILKFLMWAVWRDDQPEPVVQHFIDLLKQHVPSDHSRSRVPATVK